MKYIYTNNLYKIFLLLVVGLLTVFQLNGQTFTETFDYTTPDGVSSVSHTIGGVQFDFVFTAQGDGGDFAHVPDYGSSNSASLDIQSATPNTGTTEKITISRNDGGVFELTSLFLRNDGGTTVTIQGYVSGSPEGSAQTVANGVNGTYNFGVVVDEVQLTGTDFYQVNLDDFTWSVPLVNSAPTADNFTASNGPYENLTYTFSTSDFGFSDSDSDPLDHLLIESIPAAGTLYVDADNDDVYDGGEEVSVSDQISKADLDAGNLQYIQNGSTNTSFQFEVNDGTDNSTGNYVATLNVNPVPTVTLGISPTSKSESTTTSNTVTATLSNTYGANTLVNLSFGGTATGSGVDYSTSGTSITVAAGNTTGTINLTNVPDALYEGNETVIIDIASVSGGTENGTQQVTYTITDDDSQPNASLEILNIYNPITDESGGQAYIRGKIDAVAGTTVTIPLFFSGTATGGGTDYSLTGTSITISSGFLMDSVRLTSLFDDIEEGDETVIIDMNTPTNAVEDGIQQVTLTIEDEDATPPTGYTVGIDQTGINASNESAVSFTFAGAESGATYDYTFSSSGGGTNVTGTGTISTATDQITGIDLSGLGDGTITLSVTLTDTFGSTGTAATDTETKDTTAPTGYSVLIDQSGINNSSQSAASFTFAGAEVGATYNYTFSSSGGGTNVTGSGNIATATDQISGIDLSGLGDGTITLSVTLTDTFGNAGSAATDTETKDTTAPSGYTVSIDSSPINSGNQSAVSFTFTGAEVGATYNYTISSSGGGTNVTGSGNIATATDQITGVDLSGLGDGTVTLSVTLTDTFGNTGSAATDTETKDTTAPSGYSVQIDQNPISSANQSAVSFTFTGAEVGATYNYSISSSGGGTNVTGSGTIATAIDQITGIDLSGLGDGTITLSVTLTDTFGNTGSAATDTETKDTTAPSGYSVQIDQSPISAGDQSAVSFTFSGAEVGATYDYTFSSSGGGTNVTGSGNIATATDQISGIDLSGLGDGTVTLSVTLTDGPGNTGTAATDTENKDTAAPLGYSVSMDLLGESVINVVNESIIEFSGAGMEVGSTLHYSFTSDGGGTAVTGTETVTSSSEQFDNGGAGYDLSGLTDGTVTLTIYLTDPAGNQGADVADNESKDAGAPTGYTVAWDDNLINATEATSTSFTVSNAEIGTIVNYFISSSGDGNTATVTASSAVSNMSQMVTVDVSSLTDGTLTVQVTLTDDGGNTGSATSDNSAVLDQTEPSGYTVTFDQDPIDESNQSSVGYTFAGAEVGTTYNYIISSSGGGSNVTGSGTIGTAADQITGIDLSGLGDGTITLSVTLADAAGNTGSSNTDTSTKDTNDPPTASSISVSGTLTVGELLTGNYTYTDPDTDPESGTSYKWYRSDDNGGTGKTAISGANAQQYTLQAADQGKYISFEVTPNDGMVAGTTEESALEGPVKVDQTITFPSIPNKTYGDASFTLGDAQTDQSLTVTYTADDPSVVSITGNQATILKAGNTQITATQSGDGVTNAASPVVQPLTVNKATLTVTGDDKSKVYGATDPSLTVSYSGFENGDDATALGGTLDVSRAAGEDVGNYTITASGYTSSNYTISYVDGNFEITQAALTVTADDKSKVYGEADPSLTVNYSGFVNGDDATALGGTLDVSRAAGEDVGNYVITASGYASSNYTISYLDGNFEITQATLTVTADDQSKVYGTEDPELTYHTGSLANGDGNEVFTGRLSRAAGEEVGTYPIGIGSLSAGDNYNLLFNGAVFTIEARKLEEVYEPSPIEVAWGISLDDVILPETVLVRTEENEMINLPVTWDKTGIDLRSRGNYQITGELQLPGSVSDDAPVPYMTVVVLPKPAPTDLTLDNNEFEASIENTQIAIGAIEVIDAVDDVHVLALVSGAMDNRYFSLSGTTLYWDSAEALAGRTSFDVTVQVTDADGNIVQKSFTVTRLRKSLDEIVIYNTFTPNNDGTNDTWGVEALKFYTGVRIMVFERSGKRVFYTEDPEERWDGTFKGNELAPGSYFWVIESGETGKVRRGTLNLLRR